MGKCDESWTVELLNDGTIYVGVATEEGMAAEADEELGKFLGNHRRWAYNNEYLPSNPDATTYRNTFKGVIRGYQTARQKDLYKMEKGDRVNVKLHNGELSFTWYKLTKKLRRVQSTKMMLFCKKCKKKGMVEKSRD